MNTPIRMMKLSGSKQEEDIKAGKAPSDIFGDVLRVKTYNKVGDISYGDAVHDMEFPQPFQVAAARLGCSWRYTNPVAVVQLAGCNLDCPYCYIGDYDSVEVVGKTPQDVDDAYTEYLSACVRAGVPHSRVFRISGGEPMLQQEAVRELITVGLKRRSVTDGDTHLPIRDESAYVWVDTNLTIEPRASLLERMAVQRNVGVCGCFKSHLGLADVREQLDIARMYIDAGVDLYTYWAGCISADAIHVHMLEDTMDAWRGEALWALDEMAEVHPNLPLRNTFIRLKYHYSAVAEDGMIEGLPVELWNKVSFKKCATMRGVQREWIDERYSPELKWLPSHQVPLD